MADWTDIPNDGTVQDTPNVPVKMELSSESMGNTFCLPPSNSEINTVEILPSILELISLSHDISTYDWKESMKMTPSEKTT
ncbi:hypothetical protein CHS0354_021793 [Potamilus streckersoni]|uniref:Uncharacterized protein n=1 Tax=Potamilus streckersoni TaxID=2493646 RepID=A0AAE0S4R9_9BIVA|nr:hypothetical protein CHS0354_021793 [Potamilus streckersoni]